MEIALIIFGIAVVALIAFCYRLNKQIIEVTQEHKHEIAAMQASLVRNEEYFAIERKMLIDRILKVNGFSPIYEPEKENSDEPSVPARRDRR